MVTALAIADPASRYAAWLRVFDPGVQAELLCSDVLDRVGDHDPGQDFHRHYAALRTRDHLNRLMYVDLKTWLPDDYLEKTDKATMSCGLEARLPLLDHRLVELAFRIPSACKVRGTSTKRVFKRAVRPVLPPSVLGKPKRGFSVPTDPWLRDELRSFTFDVLTDDRTRARGIFDPRAVQQLWREHVDGRHVLDSHLWLLLTFELWCRAYLDPVAA
jgi:asparagine synthase (glutamine-hydrolysing)